MLYSSISEESQLNYTHTHMDKTHTDIYSNTVLKKRDDLIKYIFKGLTSV